jgi:hypothetical protein
MMRPRFVRPSERHPFAPHAIEVHPLRRRAAWARRALLVAVACLSFVLGFFFPR